MPLKSHLVKEGDDLDYENCCPTIGTLTLAHFSTPTKHNAVIYGPDSLFFSMYPDRRIYLRQALPNEFDIFISEEDDKLRPKLWVSVTLLTPGHHQIQPVWRGGPCWSKLESDQDVAEALMYFSERGGLRLSEWHSYICDQRVRRADAARLRTRRNKGRGN